MLRLPDLPDSMVGALIAQIVGQGLSVYRVSSERKSLEQAFLELIERPESHHRERKAVYADGVDGAGIPASGEAAASQGEIRPTAHRQPAVGYGHAARVMQSEQQPAQAVGRHSTTGVQMPQYGEGAR
jgi:hypothetical protein